MIQRTISIDSAKQSVLKTDYLFVIVGDIHHEIALAVEGLERLEIELGRSIDQVFSVGDLGLFLEPEDWDFLTGPKKYRHPDLSPVIKRAWEGWCWPLAAIAGNHEPLHIYRSGDWSLFGEKFSYTHAGELSHGIPGMHVAGLSGIYHPDCAQFITLEEKNNGRFPCGPVGWPEMVDLVRKGLVKAKRLTYFKEEEVARLKSLPPRPHILLTHDWPMQPPWHRPAHPRRPEAEVAETLQPRWIFSGHHHQTYSARHGVSEFRALNIITSPELKPRHEILSGWAWIGGWNATTGVLRDLGYWPPLKLASERNG
ncbi:MAG: metallophosphoesterase [Candidatus Methylacidiphilales bacterium]